MLRNNKYMLLRQKHFCRFWLYLVVNNCDSTFFFQICLHYESATLNMLTEIFSSGHSH